jgi:hypothetical protein
MICIGARHIRISYNAIPCFELIGAKYKFLCASSFFHVAFDTPSLLVVRTLPPTTCSTLARRKTDAWLVVD